MNLSMAMRQIPIIIFPQTFSEKYLHYQKKYDTLVVLYFFIMYYFTKSTSEVLQDFSVDKDVGLF